MSWAGITGALFGLREENEFKHNSPVDGNAIRLVHINPCSSLTFGFGKLELVIETFPIDEVPKYFALSYTWGPPDPRSPEYEEADKCPILINGQSFRVFPNLLDLLYRLRSDWHEVRPYLWIDALCINQDDPDERATQVRIMDRIYKQAFYTLVWLGKPYSLWEKYLVIDIMNRIENIPSKEIAEMALAYPDIPFLPPKGFDYYKLPQPGETWLPILCFFQQRWFNRAWVIQEVALSKNIAFLWGNQMFTWDQLHGVAAFLSRATRLGGYLVALQCEKLKERDFDKYHSDKIVENPVARFFELALLRGQCQEDIEAGKEENSQLKELREFIWMTTNETRMAPVTLSLHFAIAHRSFESSDPRDKVFGYLGIVNYLMGRETDVNLHNLAIAPDYSESATPTSLFENITSQAILQTQSLVILAALDDAPGERLKGLPSWVLDLSRSGHIPILMGIRPYFDASRSLSQDSTANITKTANRRIVDIDHHNLRVRAMHLGNLEFFGCDDNALRFGKLETWVKHLLSQELTYRYTSESRVEAFWRTIIMDQSGGYSPARWPQHEEGRPFRSWVMVGIWNKYVKDKKEGRSVDESLDELHDIDELAASDSTGHMPSTAEFKRDCERMEYLPEKLKLMARSEAVQKLRANDEAENLAFTASLPALRRRRFTVSDQGHYVLSPIWAVEGDEIVIVKGCPYPLVVRPHPEDPSSFVIVGAAYVHGIMYGEAITEHTKWENICIK